MRARAYRMKFEPLMLKEVCLAVGISQVALREALESRMGREVSRPTVNLCMNRGYIPETMPGFREGIEGIIRDNPRAMAWLLDQGLTTADIWQPAGRDMRMAYPVGHGRRSWAGRRRLATVSGDPGQITIKWEVAMISQEALKHFKVFRNPFPFSAA